MKTIQLINKPVDIANWLRDEEFAEYPEGARDKTLLYCSVPAPDAFLKAKHRYLFKCSSPRYEEQFWAEIFAYQLGVKMDICVPPTFVAYDSKQRRSGALIEWFLKEVDESYTPGGDYCQQYIPNFNRKKGEQHNFETVAQIFNDLTQEHPNFHTDWKSYWAKTFTFDALIGNTDRHQDNWGIILNTSTKKMSISPVFDNGTSMGHEIFPNKFEFFQDSNQLEKYMSKGWHHMKWELNDPLPSKHLELLKKFVAQYPEMQTVILTCLKKVNGEIFKAILDNLAAFDVPVRLSPKRAAFMLKLLQFRHQRLLIGLEN